MITDLQAPVVSSDRLLIHRTCTSPQERGLSDSSEEGLLKTFPEQVGPTVAMAATHPAEGPVVDGTHPAPMVVWRSTSRVDGLYYLIFSIR